MSRSATTLEESSATAQTVLAAPSEVDLAASAPRRRSRAWLAAPIVAVFVIAAATAMIVGGRKGRTEPPAAPTAAVPGPQPTPTQATPARPVAPPPESKVPPPPPASVTLKFVVEPAGAVISIDGVVVKDGQIVVPTSDAKHRLRIAAPGFVAHEEEVRFDENQKLTVQLKRAGRPTGSGSGGSRAHVERKVERIESKSPYDP